MEIQSISLGDALRKLAVNMQTDLQNSLLLMRGQDPELRTVEMRSFIARSRRKLTQFYAIVRWLSTAGVSQCFRGVADFNSQMATIDGEMARNLDEMYFVHASIYSMRSRPLEVTKAMDMLARKTYYNLPGAMFSCGRPEFPQALDPEEVVRDLCVFTNVKLNSSDRIGSNWPVNLSVTQGMLTIDYPGYFQLFLTLKTLSEHSDWTVLNCTLPCARTLCDSVTSKQIRAEVNQETEQLVAALRKTCATQQAICDDAAQVPAQAQDTPQQPRGALQEMLQQCRAAALAIGLKVLHQKLEVSLEAASYFKDTYHVRLVNSQQQQKELNSNKQYLSVKFWRSTFQE